MPAHSTAGIQQKHHHAFALRIEIGTSRDVELPIISRFFGSIAQKQRLGRGTFAKRRDLEFGRTSGESTTFDQTGCSRTKEWSNLRCARVFGSAREPFQGIVVLSCHGLFLCSAVRFRSLALHLESPRRG